MGVYYHYANYTKRERFSIAAVGGGMKQYDLGDTIASKAFHRLLLGEPGRQPGRWAGDSIRIVGDDNMTEEEWTAFKTEFVDLTANVILIVLDCEGFDRMGKAAEHDPELFMQLCHLVVTNQAPLLEPHLRKWFGAKYLAIYAAERRNKPHFVPKDLAPDPA